MDAYHCCIAYRHSQPQDWEKEGITHRTETARMWTYAAIVEHSVMLTRVCILVFFPVHPDWIRDARDVLRFRVNDMKKLSRARREGLAEEYSNVVSPRLDGSVNESTRKSNALKSRTFKHADVDGDRQLTREEFIQAVRFSSRLNLVHPLVELLFVAVSQLIRIRCCL